MGTTTDTREARYWTGPCLDPATGIITLDGTERLRVWEPGVGARHSLIHGDLATGKTQVALWLATEYMATGVIIPWAADPEDDPALIPLAEYGEWTTGSISESLKMLHLAADLMGHRAASPAGQGLAPTRDVPMLRLIIPAADVILRDPEHGGEAVRLCEQLAQHGPLAGIGLDVIVADPTLECLRSPVLLAALQAGNVIGMRAVDGMPGFLPGEPPCRAPLLRDAGAAIGDAALGQPSIDWNWTIFNGSPS